MTTVACAMRHGKGSPESEYEVSHEPEWYEWLQDVHEEIGNTLPLQ